MNPDRAFRAAISAVIFFIFTSLFWLVGNSLMGSCTWSAMMTVIVMLLIDKSEGRPRFNMAEEASEEEKEQLKDDLATLAGIVVTWGLVMVCC